MNKVAVQSVLLGLNSGIYPVTNPRWGSEGVQARSGVIPGIVTVAGVAAFLQHYPPPRKFTFSWFGVKRVQLPPEPCARSYMSRTVPAVRV